MIEDSDTRTLHPPDSTVALGQRTMDPQKSFRTNEDNLVFSQARAAAGPCSDDGADGINSSEPPGPAHHHSTLSQDYFGEQIQRPASTAVLEPSSRPAPSAQTSSNSLPGVSNFQPYPSQDLQRFPSAQFEPGQKGRASHSKSSSTSMIAQEFFNNEQPISADQSSSNLQTHFLDPRPSLPLRSHSSRPSPALLNTDISESMMPTGWSAQPTAKTVGSTPLSSPGLFPHPAATDVQAEEQSRPNSPLLYPAHTQKPKTTTVAEVDRDMYTGNKYINEYEILSEIGRGEHGKVKLGRRLGEEWNVAIKIVPRYSKKRRLGKLGAPEDETRREVAVLKRARHPNVVALYEVIDDPNKNKVYLVLEYVEHGEIKWRKEAPAEILSINRWRAETK